MLADSVYMKPKPSQALLSNLHAIKSHMCNQFIVTKYSLKGNVFYENKADPNFIKIYILTLECWKQEGG